MAVIKYKSKDGSYKTLMNYNVNNIPVVQGTGADTASVMSQKAVTDELAKKADAATAVLTTQLNQAISDARSNWNTTDTNADSFIKNKPTKVSDFENDKVFQTKTEVETIAAEKANDVKNDLLNGAPEAYDTLKELADALTADDGIVAGLTTTIGKKANTEDVERDYVKKETGKRLISDTEAAKLGNIADGAEVNVQSDWNEELTTSDAYIKNKPTALPANGGNADTVGGHRVGVDVPANAKFTDTVYTLPLASSSDRGGVKIGYTQSGKNYPVQLDAEKMYVNVPWSADGGNAATVGGKTVGVNVPADAKFTDTTYTDATTSTHGLMSTTDKGNLDFLMGVDTRSSVSSIPVDKRLVVISVSSSATFSLSSLPTSGREVHCIIKNTGSSDITITIPDSGNYMSAIGTTLKIKAGKFGEVNVISDGSKGYIRGV